LKKERQKEMNKEQQPRGTTAYEMGMALWQSRFQEAKEALAEAKTPYEYCDALEDFLNAGTKLSILRIKKAKGLLK